eukprot:357678-Chlamydomonas_euryale.AAC.15
MADSLPPNPIHTLATSEPHVQRPHRPHLADSPSHGWPSGPAMRRTQSMACWQNDQAAASPPVAAPVCTRTAAGVGVPGVACPCPHICTGQAPALSVAAAAAAEQQRQMLCE